MATLKLPARRLILAGGFAVAIATAPVVAVVAVPNYSAPTITATTCSNGEIEDTFTGTCVPDLVPNGPQPKSAPAAQSIPPVQASPGGLASIDGIPCTGGNSGECIGLSEEQQAEGPAAVPHSSVSSSP